MSDEETLFEFPCDFPVKAMGAATESFAAEVITIVRRHVPDLDESTITTRDSNGGRYLSITITVRATSKRQLDAIYLDLSASEQVLMAL